MVAKLNQGGSLSPVARECWAALGQLGGDVMAAFFIGGLLLALLCVPPTYIGVLRFARRRRAKRLEKHARARQPQC